jgi:hypothetical protein
VFDLGKQRLKSGQSEASLFSGFAAKNPRIQFVGRFARMAQELPEIKGAAKSSKRWGVLKDGMELLRAEFPRCLAPFWNSARGMCVLTNGS